MDAATSERLYHRLKAEFTERVIPRILMVYLTCLTRVDEEKIRLEEERTGPSLGAAELFRRLVDRPNWFEDLVKALRHRNVGLADLADKFCRERTLLPVHVSIQSASNGDQIQISTPEEDMDVEDEPPQATSSQQQLLNRFQVILQNSHTEESLLQLSNILGQIEVQWGGVRIGSIIFMLHPRTLESLNKLIEWYEGGILARLINTTIVTPELFQKFREEAVLFEIKLESVKLKITVDMMEVESCKNWLILQKELLFACKPVEGLAMLNTGEKTFGMEKEERAIKRIKALRIALTPSLLGALEDPFLEGDFIQAGPQVLNYDGSAENGEIADRSVASTRIVTLSDSRRVIYDIMSWMEGKLNEKLFSYTAIFKDQLATLCLAVLGNVCVRNKDSVMIMPKGTQCQVMIEKGVAKFLKEEFIEEGMPLQFYIPGNLLELFHTGSVVIAVSIERLQSDGILYPVPMDENEYKFVSCVLRDTMIVSHTLFKIIPKVQRTTRSSLLSYAHKLRYIHIPVCMHEVREAVHIRHQVVINFFKELEKESPENAYEFAVTLLHSLEFCPHSDSKKRLEYFGSKINLLHLGAIFKFKESVLGPAAKQFLATCVFHGFLNKVELAGSNSSSDMNKILKENLQDFRRTSAGPLKFRMPNLQSLSNENILAVFRCIQILDLVNCSSEEQIYVEREDGSLIVELQKDSPAFTDGIEIDISFNVLDLGHLERLIHCLQTLSYIVVLSLQGTYIQPKNGLAKLLHNCDRLSTITKLDLSKSPMLSSQTAPFGFRYIPNVTQLDVSYCNLSDRSFKNLCKDICHLTKLSQLCINDNDITHSGLTSLSIAILNNGSLVKFMLCNNPLGQEGGIPLNIILQKNSFLEIFDISNCSLLDHGLNSLASALPKSLKFFSFGKNHAVSSGTRSILQAIKKCTKLQRLNIDECLICSPESGPSSSVEKEFVAIICTSSAWDYLSMNHCNLGKTEVFQQLAQDMQYLSELTVLNLEGNGLDETQVSWLSKILNHLEFLQTLNLSKNGLEDESLLILIENLRTEALETVVISYNKVKMVETAKDIIDKMLQKKRLSSLDLRQNSFRVPHLLQMLKEFSANIEEETEVSATIRINQLVMNL
ncbi:hypothetical protein CHS0354_043062 [Potamilus streckersoni]|uniref:Caspase recruitment domain-containing protein n=1 Tax=Potamilus streckersoni TaxID=2493646 RepID=A0AAE0SCY7_9BIVA|nr:hypothetical protein CHS0354_043062 [Potamilus streckersoni]